jgi:hypothetical protein
MTTVAVYAAQMKGQGVSDDDIVQQLRQQTGKHKPGPNDEVPGTPPSQPLPQGNGQPEGLGMAAPTPQGLTGQGVDTPMLHTGIRVGRLPTALLMVVVCKN